MRAGVSNEKKRLQSGLAHRPAHTPENLQFRIALGTRASKSRFSSSAHHEIGNLARVSRGQIKNVSWCARVRERRGLTNVLSERASAHTRSQSTQAGRPTTTLLITQRRARNYFGAARKQCISRRKTIQMYACVSFDLWCWVSHAAAPPTKKDKSLARHGAWMRDARAPLSLVLFIFSHCERRRP